ncbi:MAG TPA: MFS transporter [Solirubrobacterales bacterium]|nr:MFS transporter [Solirubrobacterales bacterium]
MGSPGRGRRVVIAYSLVAAATQILWLTFAPIDTSAAHHYGVSTDAIGWLAEIFPLLYVVLALPAGRLLDAGFRPALASGAGLVALGGVLRLGGQTFAWAMAGQVAVAVAQPLILNAVGKLAADYLPAEDRPAGIAAGAGAGFAGMLIALLLGPTLGGGGHIERLLIVEAILALAAAAILVWELRAPAPNEGPGEERAAVEGRAVRALWAKPQMRNMAGLVFVGFGVFVALTTWLQTLLEPAGVSEGAAGALLVGMLVFGMVGCAILPPLVDRRGAERAFMRAAAITAILGPTLLGLATPTAARAIILAAMGFVLLPALPIILTAAERLSGPTQAATAGAIVWLAGNLGGLVVALVVQALVHHPTAAFLAMAALSLPAIWLAERFRPPPVLTPSF